MMQGALYIVRALPLILLTQGCAMVGDEGADTDTEGADTETADTEVVELEASAGTVRPLLLPFSAGESWQVCQGYKTGTHATVFALDLTTGGAPCNANGATGKAARSPYRATVAGKWADGICLNIVGGGSFKLGHIYPTAALSAGATVTAGQQVGTVRPPQPGNAQLAHLHVEVYGTTGCTSSFTPFAGGNRMQCAPDLPSNVNHKGKTLTRPLVMTTSPFLDICNSKFKKDIEWLEASGITAGCAADRFCPGSTVTRDQMATFLSRAFSLPGTSRDYFGDDEGNIHEAAINRLAAAGITAGCDTGKYCPSSKVTRASMATFLDRALDLPATSTDYFDDDDGHAMEAAINRAAAAGIVVGCGTRQVCPDHAVTREQMAAFLRRALT